MNYPSEKADSLGLYVRKTSSISRTAHHLYESIRWLEMKKSKLCGTVFAGYREIADEARIDIKSVKSALQELQTVGLVEIVFGRPVKSQKLATSIRRKTLDEIKARSREGDGDAQRLAAALVKRSFFFFDKLITPCWTVGKTGRVCSSNPNIQGKSPADRLNGLKIGLENGHALVYADIKQAEPSIIKHLLKIPQTRDLYQEYMDAALCSRKDAKKAINSLAYCRNAKASFAHWPTPAQTALRDYVELLAAYKKGLVTGLGKIRSVTTITGRVIVANKGCRLHVGKLMNWRVQGTVADIVNAACLRLLDSAIAIVPVHDAVYAVTANNQTAIVGAAITNKAQEVGLSLTIATEVHHPRLVVPETTTRKSISKSIKLYPKSPPITT